MFVYSPVTFLEVPYNFYSHLSQGKKIPVKAAIYDTG
jgi:hypothetical protein